MNIESQVTSIMSNFCEFTDGIRLLMLIDRGVQNSNKGSRRWINKIITCNKEEFEQALNRLLDLQYHINDPDVRLYSCVNSRNIYKAINLFNHSQLDLNNNEILKFYSKINNTFCSSLMKPECRKTKYFLLDWDEKSVSCIADFIVSNTIESIHHYKTKKGWHFIVKPFDVRLLENIKNVTLQKDGLLLLNYIKE